MSGQSEQTETSAEVRSLHSVGPESNVGFRLVYAMKSDWKQENIIVFTELNDRLLQTVGQKGDGAEAQSGRLVMKAAPVQRGPEESEDAADERHSETSHD